MIESYARNNGGKVKTYEKIKIPEGTSETYFSVEDGIGYIKVRNGSLKWFSTTVTMKKMSGLKIIKPDKLPYKFDMHPGM